jgi:hypothetical protein
MNDPFAAGSGSGSPVVKFAAVGDTVTGVVKSVEQQQDAQPDGTLKTWPDGKPMAVYVFTLDVDGDEMRLFVRGNMVTAIREAAGSKSTIGHLLTVKHHDVGEAKRGFSPAKLFKAKVEWLTAAATPTPAAAEEVW